MTIDDLIDGQVSAVGVPFHGPVNVRTITLPNGDQPNLPRTPSGDSFLMAATAGATTQTTGLDAAKGYKWRDRFVMNRGLYGLSGNEWVYRDQNGAHWVIQIERLLSPATHPRTINRFRLSVLARFGVFGVDPLPAPYLFYDSGDIDETADMQDHGVYEIAGNRDTIPNNKGDKILCPVTALYYDPAYSFGVGDPLVRFLKIYQLSITGAVDPATGAGLTGSLTVSEPASACCAQDAIITNTDTLQDAELSVVDSWTVVCGDPPTYDEGATATIVGGAGSTDTDVTSPKIGETHIETAFHRVIAKFWDEDGFLHVMGLRHRRKYDYVGSSSLAATFTMTAEGASPDLFWIIDAASGWYGYNRTSDQLKTERNDYWITLDGIDHSNWAIEALHSYSSSASMADGTLPTGITEPPPEADIFGGCVPNSGSRNPTPSGSDLTVNIVESSYTRTWRDGTYQGQTDGQYNPVFPYLGLHVFNHRIFGLNDDPLGTAIGKYTIGSTLPGDTTDVATWDFDAQAILAGFTAYV